MADDEKAECGDMREFEVEETGVCWYCGKVLDNILHDLRLSDAYGKTSVSLCYRHTDHASKKLKPKKVVFKIPFWCMETGIKELEDGVRVLYFKYE